MALHEDGSLYAWGSNFRGEIGDGTTQNRAEPVRILSLDNVYGVAAGWEHSIALKSDGTVWAWGNNDAGQVGDGTNAQRNSPVQVPGLSDIASVGAGFYHSFAIKSDGSLWAWGANWSGQLGDGTNNNQPSPVQVSGIQNVIQIDGGVSHSVGLTADGTVWTWGWGGNGQLGDGTWGFHVTPQQIPNFSNIVMISAAEIHSLALKADGTVWGWGRNDVGQLGDGTNIDRNSPVQVSGLTNIVAVAAGQYHSMALESDGTVWVWGAGWNGQAGVGTTSNHLTPVRVPGLTGAWIAAGTHSVVMKSDGTVAAWGWNAFGQIGDGTFYNEAHSPVSLDGLMLSLAPAQPSFSVIGGAYASVQNVAISCATPNASIHYTTNGSNPTESDPTIASGAAIQVDRTMVLKARAFASDMLPSPIRAAVYTMDATVAANGNHSLAKAADGSLWAWGQNHRGQIGDGTFHDRVLPVQIESVDHLLMLAAGWEHSLALRQDGTVWTWGNNDDGQLGDGSNNQRNVPTPVGALIGIKAIGAGYYHTLAVQSDGTVLACGSNLSGQLGNGGNNPSSYPVQVAGLDHVVAVTGGMFHSAALKDDGTVWAWGAGTVGELGNGQWDDKSTPTKVVNLSNVIAVAAGIAQTYALKADGTVWAWGRNDIGQLGDGTNIDRSVPVQVLGLSGVVAIGAGQNHLMALTNNGTVSACGANWNGQMGDGTFGGQAFHLVATLVPGFSNVMAIGAGTHNLALKTDGSVWSWAYNAYGQLGQGDYDERHVPVQIEGLDLSLRAARPKFSVEGGIYRAAQDVVISCATQGASIHYTTDGSEPTEASASIASGSSVHIAQATMLRARAFAAGQKPSAMKAGSYQIGSQVVAGFNHALVADEAGALWAWGDNATGNLGNGSTEVRPTPMLINGISNVQSLAGGYRHSMVLTDYGSVWVSGDNTYGQLGLPGATQTTSFAVIGLDGIQHIGAGYFHSMAVDSQGAVWTWGRNQEGQIGNGTNVDVASPVQVAGLTGIIAVEGGAAHSVALKNDGTVWTWGYGGLGQLGNGAWLDQFTPVQVNHLTDVVAIAAGDLHTVALKSDGTVWAWGRNDIGQLGDGSTTDSNLPVMVPGLSDVVAISAGQYHTLALKRDGTLVAWGMNLNGQLGDGSNTFRYSPTPVAILNDVTGMSAGTFSLAVRKDDGVWSWGYNAYGQIGNGLFVDQKLPTEVLLLRDDADRNGLPDSWEIRYFGSAGQDLNGDPDADNLTNLDEYINGTNPTMSDTDDDTVSDGEEVHITHTDPLAQNFSGIQTVAEARGAQATARLGQWTIDGTDIYAVSRRGYVEYTLSVPTADMYRIQIEGSARMFQDVSTFNVLNWDLLVSVDGEFVNHVVLRTEKLNSGLANTVSPWLTPGAHTIRVYWDNAASYKSLQVKAVRLQSLMGPDQNGNGVKDWVENLLHSQSGVESIATSAISPACIEGRDRYLGMISVSGNIEPKHGAGDRWYANIPLSASGPTSVHFSFQDGGLHETKQFIWKPTNILDAEDMTIRKGDSLLLAATPEGAESGSVAITVGGNSLQSNGLNAIAHEFATAGTYTVTGTYTPAQGAPVTGSFTVKVVDCSMDPVVDTWAGRLRYWTAPNLVEDTIMEASPTLRVQPMGLLPNGGRTFNLTSDESPEACFLVARLPSGGPILCSTEIKSFRLYSANETNMAIVQKYADGSQLIEDVFVASPVLPDVSFDLSIYVGGVTFEDGTIDKVLTADDFNEIGECKVRFIRSPNSETSVCHTTKAYQGDAYLGAAR